MAHPEMAVPRLAPETHQAESPAALHDRLAKAIEQLVNSEQWTAWLDVAARFHTHSTENTLLIWDQRPSATVIAGRTTWQRLGRRVLKGESAIAILAPIMSNAEPDAALAAAEPCHSGTGRPASQHRPGVVDHRRTYVWDIEQTIGDPLPIQPPIQLLTGEAPDDLWSELSDEVAALGFELRIGTCPDPSAKGYTDFMLRTVTVRPGLSDAQAVKALAHELGHISLHNPNTCGEPLRPCRGIVEVEAESIAYLVAAAHGMDTRDFTFPYVTGMAAARTAGRGPDEVVRLSVDRVLTAAHRLLNRLGHRPTQHDVVAPPEARSVRSDLPTRSATAGPSARRTKTPTSQKRTRIREGRRRQLIEPSPTPPSASREVHHRGRHLRG